MDMAFTGLVFFISIIILSILSYCVNAIGYYVLSKRANIPYAWIAWLPGIYNFLLGDLIDNKALGIPFMNWILLFLQVPYFLIGLFASANNLGTIIMLYLIYGIVNIVIYYTALYKLFSLYNPYSKGLYLVLSIISFNTLIPLLVYLIRYNNRVDQTPQPQVYNQQQNYYRQY